MQQQEQQQRVIRLAGHLQLNPVSSSPAASTVLGRVSTAAEPGLLDAQRRTLECSSIHEREAWLRYFTSVEPEKEEGEFHVGASEVQGQIPEFLRGGTFIRSGPGLFERNGVRIHMADGDGLIVTVRFNEDGSLLVKKKYIPTSEFKQEQAEKRILFRGSYGTSQVQAEGIKQRVIKNVGNLKWKITGNTNHLFWGGRLFALHEVGFPIELDPRTLEIVDPRSTLNGVLDAVREGESFSAHHRVDPHSQTLLNFGINFFKYDITFWEMDKRFALLSKLRIRLFPTIVHSFAVTENYFVQYFAPTRGGIKYFFGWGVDDSIYHDVDAPCAYICVLKRNVVCHDYQSSLEHVTWHKVVNWWPNHHVTAFETGDGNLCLDSVMYEHKTQGWIEREPFDLPPTRLVRFHVQQSKASPACREYRTTPLWATHEILHNRDCEMPVINAQCDTREPRFVYLVDMCAKKLPQAALQHTSSPYSTKFGGALVDMPWSGLVKLDLKRKTVQEYHPQRFTGEAVFVPDPEARQREEEDGGVLLSLLFDPIQLKSELAVLDARDITRGALARIPLPGGHVPFSFHCGFERF